MRGWIALLALALTGSAIAAPVQVGKSSIEVPTPAGFARAVPEMTALMELQQSFVPPTNVALALYIPEAGVSSALAGEIPNLDRRFFIQASKEALNVKVTPSQFASLQRSIATDNEKTYAAMKEQMPELMSQVSQGVSRQLDMDILVNAGGMVPLPVHHQDAHSIASSLITRYEYDLGNGETIVDVVAATSTIALVNGHLIFIYVYGKQDDLEWTRKAGKEWTQAIIEANAKSPSSSSIGSLGGSRGSIWEGAGRKAAAGMIMGLFFGAIAALFALIRHRKKNKS